ncbi:MAG: cbb3-type cytochrome c oxidase subunit II [Anaeromyxobacter sp.]
MAGTIYRKPILFAVVATVVILAGSLATMALPMLRSDLHPKIDALRPLPALELAGRDLYQREGCVNCHSQMIRPLRSEVIRYKGSQAAQPAAQYSMAGEFAYDHPFLWGSKRTGPDLAFEGWIKPSRDWHRAHFVDPQSKVPKSNMPSYAFLGEAQVDGAQVQASMRALARLGVPYQQADIDGAPAAVQGKTELDALVAYTVSLGRAVERGAPAGTVDLAMENPVAGDAAAVARGARLFADNGCSACHGDDARGAEGVPSLVDDTFLGEQPDLPDAAYFALIKGGSDNKGALGRKGQPDGGMPANDLPDDDVWSIIAWIRSQHAGAAH